MRPRLSGRQWREVGLWTLAAAAALGAVLAFRGRPALTHMDFVAGGPGALQFCDPANPRFLAVVERSSPVELAVATAAPAAAFERVRVLLTLRTNTGKPIGPRDLRPTGQAKLNLLIVDPALADFQVVRPDPGDRPGEWPFTFTPRRSGVYRVFADFTPEATGREMYAFADLPVASVGEDAAARLPAAAAARMTSVERGGLRFALRPAQEPVRAREPTVLGFTAERPDGGPVTLDPVDGEPARLVAFDRDRTGFVNLRPEPADPAAPADAAVRLAFKVTIPDPGRYVVWSRIRTGGVEIAAPFSLEVSP